MKRWLFNFAAWVSLVLCGLALGIAVRTYFIADNFRWERTTDWDLSAEESNHLVTQKSIATSWGVLYLGTYTEELTSDRVGSGVPFARNQTTSAFKHSTFEPTSYLILFTNAGFVFRFAGFGYAHLDEMKYGRHIAVRTASVPLWFVALATGILPFRMIQRYRSTKREEARLATGLCPKCGYDLRATPERCPECGLASTAASQP